MKANSCYEMSSKYQSDYARLPTCCPCPLLLSKCLQIQILPEYLSSGTTTSINSTSWPIQRTSWPIQRTSWPIQMRAGMTLYWTTCRGRSGLLDRPLNWTTLLKSNFTIHGTVYLITLHLKSSPQRADGEQGACFEEVGNKCFLLPLI